MDSSQAGRRAAVILIDCSELELGRNLGRRIGRLDDSVVASRRKLQVYRDNTLPMLRTLDEEGKLIVIDGDSDEDHVLRELKRQILTITSREIERPPLEPLRETSADAEPDLGRVDRVEVPAGDARKNSTTETVDSVEVAMRELLDDTVDVVVTPPISLSQIKGTVEGPRDGQPENADPNPAKKLKNGAVIIADADFAVS
ncbi:unnamed protein product [Darwinula stevensoni]|uniref:Uncharacterized protein n=1 Tax=Darwinula stevensoni TaxID=69355 RepID=A0A7R9A6L6_9CRUS|nr:unnamed protein product [Darwinula stevensoni]CAG0894995.1 unnamed protein product [Darwinula stevensoni]